MNKETEIIIQNKYRAFTLTKNQGKNIKLNPSKSQYQKKPFLNLVNSYYDKNYSSTPKAPNTPLQRLKKIKQLMSKDIEIPNAKIIASSKVGFIANPNQKRKLMKQMQQNKLITTQSNNVIKHKYQVNALTVDLQKNIIHEDIQFTAGNNNIKKSSRLSEKDLWQKYKNTFWKQNHKKQSDKNQSAKKNENLHNETKIEKYKKNGEQSFIRTNLKKNNTLFSNQHLQKRVINEYKTQKTEEKNNYKDVFRNNDMIYQSPRTSVPSFRHKSLLQSIKQFELKKRIDIRTTFIKRKVNYDQKIKQQGKNDFFSHQLIDRRIYDEEQDLIQLRPWQHDLKI